MKSYIIFYTEPLNCGTQCLLLNRLRPHLSGRGLSIYDEPSSFRGGPFRAKR